MHLDMTTFNLDKKKFVDDCIAEYRTGDEYDISIVFDEYFDKTIDIPEFRNILSPNDLENLHNELYLMVEKELVNEYESDADTDDEKS